MATWRIKSVSRPRVQNSATGEFEDADYLRVQVASDEDEEGTVVLAMADHSGLEAEWNAGLVTTVLDAAVDAKIAADIESADDGLPSGTKTGKDGYTYTS